MPALTPRYEELMSIHRIDLARAARLPSSEMFNIKESKSGELLARLVAPAQFMILGAIIESIRNPVDPATITEKDGNLKFSTPPPPMDLSMVHDIIGLFALKPDYGKNNLRLSSAQRLIAEAVRQQKKMSEDDLIAQSRLDAEDIDAFLNIIKSTRSNELTEVITQTTASLYKEKARDHLFAIKELTPEAERDFRDKALDPTWQIVTNYIYKRILQKYKSAKERKAKRDTERGVLSEKVWKPLERAKAESSKEENKYAAEVLPNLDDEVLDQRRAVALNLALTAALYDSDDEGLESFTVAEYHSLVSCIPKDYVSEYWEKFGKEITDHADITRTDYFNLLSYLIGLSSFDNGRVLTKDDETKKLQGDLDNIISLTLLDKIGPRTYKKVDFMRQEFRTDKQKIFYPLLWPQKAERPPILVAEDLRNIIGEEFFGTIEQAAFWYMEGVIEQIYPNLLKLMKERNDKRYKERILKTYQDFVDLSRTQAENRPHGIKLELPSYEDLRNDIMIQLVKDNRTLKKAGIFYIAHENGKNMIDQHSQYQMESVT